MTTTRTATRAKPSPGMAGESSVSLVPWLFGNRPTHNGDTGDNGEVGDPRTRALSDPEIAAVVGVGLATLVLGTIGLVNSFRAVAAAAAPSFGAAAWTVPLAIDIGILVFSALDLVLARLDMRVRWLRLVPWSLVGITIYLNIAAETSWFGRISHATLPALWVIAVEVGTHAVRTRAGLTSARRMDRIRGSRWLLDPLGTLLLWRRMVLWEIRSYPDALARERTRLLALTGLQDTYGRFAWRWKAPRRDRALYRLGELTPAHSSPGAPATDVPAEAVTDPAGAHDRPGLSAVDEPTRTRRTSRRAGDRTRVNTSGRAAGADTAAAVARLRREQPDMSAAVIADRLGVSDRTVRRHLSALTDSQNVDNGTAAAVDLETARAS